MDLLGQSQRHSGIVVFTSGLTLLLEVCNGAHADPSDACLVVKENLRAGLAQLAINHWVKVRIPI